MTSRKRLLIVDDYPPLVQAYRGLVEPEYEVVGVATDGSEVFEASLLLKPDVVIMDLGLPNLNGFDAGDRLKHAIPNIKLIYVGADESAAFVLEAFRRGASAYVVKTLVSVDLKHAIRSSLAGSFYISIPLARDMVDSRMPFTTAGRANFTRRQTQIFEMLIQGHTAEDISAALKIKPGTVAYHKLQIMQILGLSSKVELTVLVLSLRTLGRCEPSVSAD